MVVDLRLDATDGLVVLSWRTAEDGLYLTAHGRAGEARLQCICGRCHWIVREHFSPGQALLMVTCHNCGQRRAFPVQGARLPA